MSFNLHLGDSLEILKTLAADSVDAVVTDPPYGFSFMGKKWDYELPSVELWGEVLRVLKPGGHLLGFGGARTYHRAVCRIEDAGFEIRDCVMWVYGSGFPKSLDVSKAIDKAAGAEREVVARVRVDGKAPGRVITGFGNGDPSITTIPATPAAQQWQGWGTALKPAHEPIVLARKPLGEGTVAGNVMKWGTGGINVDKCRVGTAKDMNPGDFDDSRRTAPKFSGKFNNGQVGQYTNRSGTVPDGRWPANFIHDGSDEVVGMFPVTTSGSGDRNGAGKHEFLRGVGDTGVPRVYNIDTGSASRFFYCAKASRSEREAGCDGLVERALGMSNAAKAQGEDYENCQSIGLNVTKLTRNHHPTVKPISLMRYLCRLITPPNGIILDPFMGSGTTGAAAMLEGFNFIGIEREPEYIEIARRRIEHWKDESDEADEKQPELFEMYG